MKRNRETITLLFLFNLKYLKYQKYFEFYRKDFPNTIPKHITEFLIVNIVGFDWALALNHMGVGHLRLADCEMFVNNGQSVLNSRSNRFGSPVFLKHFQSH